jgi:glycosyltransferase involved in cell wall biosynthesis
MGRALAFVQRHCLPYDDALPWIPYAVDRAGQVLALRKAEAVLSTSPPIAAHLAAYRVSRRHKLKWIADFRDPLYGNPFRTRKLGWIYDALLERLIVTQADAIIANTDTVADMLRQRYPRHARKIQVIWNGYDPDEAPKPERPPRREHRVLSHVGSIYGGRHPEALLCSLDRLIERGLLQPESFRVRLIGPVDSPEPWSERPASRALKARGCLEIIGHRVPEAEAKRAMAEADFLLLLDLNHKDVGLQVPAKLFDYVHTGRPILALTTPGSPAERILSQSGVPCLFIHSQDSPEVIDQKVIQLLSLPLEPVTVSDWFRRNFSADGLANTLSGLLDDCLNEP